MMEEVILSFGSNLGDKSQNLTTAVGMVENQIGPLKIISSIYKSEAWGFDGGSFENLVAKYETTLSPEKVLEKILAIEEKLGRIRSENGYKDRIIDIDIISYGNWIVKSNSLQIPHPHMHERNFVLQPLAEIDPKWPHPILLNSAIYLLVKSTDKIAVKCLK